MLKFGLKKDFGPIKHAEIKLYADRRKKLAYGRE